MRVEKTYKADKKGQRIRRNSTCLKLQDITSSIENVCNEPTLSSSTCTPNSSQTNTSTPSTPSTSPQHHQSPSTIRHATRQSILSFGIDERKQCKECGMSYLKNVQSDIKIHHKYHQKYLNGRDWSHNWGSKLTNFSSSEYICCVNPTNTLEAKAAVELLEVVNHELNAPDDNEFWLRGDDFGKVFVYVKDKKAIGVLSIERIRSGKWFSVDDGKVVSTIDVELLAGISRIYVCNNHRRLGIALQLLQAAQEHLIYGLIVPKSKFGWSQPSSSGGKLAKSFNGAKHKSGKILIPVYT